MRNLKPFSFYVFFFALARERIFIKMYSIESRCVLGPANILPSCAHLVLEQHAGSFTVVLRRKQIFGTSQVCYLTENQFQNRLLEMFVMTHKPQVWGNAHTWNRSQPGPMLTYLRKPTQEWVNTDTHVLVLTRLRKLTQAWVSTDTRVLVPTLPRKPTQAWRGSVLTRVC